MAASSTIFFLVFGMTRPGIEPLSPGPLKNPGLSDDWWTLYPSDQS